MKDVQANKYAPLLEPFKIGNVELRNRFIMGPMGMAWLADAQGAFTDEAAAFYEERAKGGFAGIVTGVQLVDQTVDRQMGPSEVPLRHPEHFVEQSRKTTEAVEAAGSKIFLELGFGVGRNYPTFKAPSALPAHNFPTFMSTPLTRKEIGIKRDGIIRTAVLGKEAGFAGVDLHSLHWGYLLDQFVLAITNRRTDEYGGTLENRLRLVRETVEGIHRECGEDYPVIVGLGVKSFIKGLDQPSLFGEDEAGRTVEESIEIVKQLEEMGIAAIMTDVGLYDSFYYACPPSYMPKGHGLEYYKPIREAVSIPILARSRMGDPDVALRALTEGYADAVVMSRPSLADPEFPNKVAAGQADRIRPCIGCNMGCIGRCLETQQHESCAANPRACYEASHPVKKTAAPKKIAVVGGGVAGMQAALTAAEIGHKPEIFEKTDVLGGELNAAGAHAFKEDIHGLRDWFIAELKEQNVPIHMNTEFSTELYKDGAYDLVIMATGASSVVPASIPGIEKAITAVDLLEKDIDPGETVIVVGGGMVGCETAVDLAQKGKKVTIVEMLPDVLSSEFVPQQHKMMLLDMIKAYNVDVCADYKLAEVTDEGAVVEVAKKLFTIDMGGSLLTSLKAGDRKTLKADKVILSVGLKPNKTITEDLRALGAEVIEVGSTKRAGNVIDATHDAYEAIYALD